MAGFIDRMVVGLNKGVTSVSEGSKTLIEKAKLNTQIQDFEREKNQIIQSMGTLVYNLQTSGTINIEQCDGMCNEINTLNQKISELQEQVKAIDAAKAAAQMEAQTQYAQPVAPIENGVQCACGFVNKAGAKFCARCGNALEA